MKSINNNVDFYDEVSREKVTLIDFWAEWCGPCKMLTPILEELDLEYSQVDFFKVDADANTELAKELEISSLPTVMIWRNGEVIARQTGAKPKALMRKFINDAISN
jgi:thioredoxin 1